MIGRKNRYRIVVSVVFGLLGFWINFYSFEPLDYGSFTISVLPGLLFPLLIALAWGWRYGLLSALAGGCQTMWILWYGDGWGILYSVPVFTLWILWHGYWADDRSRRYGATKKVPFLKHPYVVELPFRLLAEAGFFTIFPLLVSLNPPPWDPELASDTVHSAWIVTVTVKHLINGYILLFVAHLLLRIRNIRRFFRLPQQPGESGSSHIVVGAALTGVLFWFVDSFLDHMIFQTADRSFQQALLSPISPHEAFMRVLFTVVFFAGGLTIAHFWREREAMKDRSEYYNRILRGIRNVNQLITQETDPYRLLEGSCALLTDTQGYFSTFIIHIRGPEAPTDGARIYSSKLGPNEDKLRNHLERGGTIPCVENAAKSDAVVVTDDPGSECDCPIAETYERSGSLSIRIHYGQTTYGVLSASVPRAYIHDEDEHQLLREVAGDIAYALHSIEGNRMRQEAEERLKVSERDKSLILNITNELIAYYTPDLRIIWANKAAADTVGMNMDELEGHHCYELWQRRDAPCENCPVLRALESGKAEEEEQTTPDGKTYSIRGFPVFDHDGNTVGLIEFSHDISKRKQAEKAMAESRERYRTLFDKAADAIFVSDLEGKIVSANKKACEGLGYTLEELKTLSVENVDADYYNEEQFRKLVSRLLSEKQIRTETHHIRSDGSRFPVQNNIALLELPQHEAVVNIARDITEIREAHRRISGQLEEKEVLLKEIHHRVKNNLNVVASLLRLQADTVETPEESKKALHESTDRIYSMALVHEQLYRADSFSKIDMGVYLHSMLNHVRNVYDPYGSAELGVYAGDITLDITKAIPCGIILSELVTNAYKYAFAHPDNSSRTIESTASETAQAVSTETGEGEARIEVSLQHEKDEMCRLVVEDNGVGFDASPEANDFETLGLQLVETLVKQIDGEIRVESGEETGRGTRFTIIFTC